VNTIAFLLKGLGIGLALAAPVGPMSILCMRRTLRDGLRVGLISGLGIAAADATYGAMAAFGLSAVTAWLLHMETVLRLIGGLFLIGLGVRILLKPPAAEAAPAAGGRMAGAFASCFVLTMTNPATILTFIAIFAGLGLVGQAGGTDAAIGLVAGVFLGSMLWWVALCGTVATLRHRIGQTALIWINRLFGLILAGFGAGILISVAV
jgi:threonine/homoserine/homoserine lactone efflux protein